jgi:hypothetical protein
VFCESVQHRLLFCLNHLYCFKTVAFQFYFQSEKQRKVRWTDTTVILFWLKIPWWKRKCETARCRDSTASSFVTKFRGEVLSTFSRSRVKRHSTMCQDEFFVNSPWYQRKLMTLVFTCLAFLVLGEFGLQVYGSCFLSRTLV